MSFTEHWPRSAGTLEHEQPFRARVIDAIGDVGYVDRDCVTGTCPLCGGWLAVRFAGAAPRASFTCGNRCSQHDILATIALGANTISPELQRAHAETATALAAAETWRRRYVRAIDGWRAQLAIELADEPVGLRLAA